MTKECYVKKADDHSSSRILLKGFVDSLKLSPSEKGLRELREIVGVFLEEVAACATPIINHLASGQPASTFSEKKELAKWINGQAAELGLAVRCPKTEKPAYFIGNGSHNPEHGRFQLVLCEDGKARTLTSAQLPEFELVPREGPLFPKRSWRVRSENGKQKEINR